MKTQERKKKVIVVGGGPAGMMCAIWAGKNGADVTLYEKNRSERIYSSENYFDNAYLGKKLLITGKGRCNVTNNCSIEEFLSNVPVNPKFLYTAINYLTPQNLMDFFETSGVCLKTERANRVFPTTDKSLDILNALKLQLRENSVKIVNKRIIEINIKDSGFESVTDEDKNRIYADACVVCTGGISYPITGSDGDGYVFAEKTGHKMVQPKPSLVPLVITEFDCSQMQGLSLKNVTLTVRDNHKKKVVFREFGEMLFTHFGISGPLVLSASSVMRNMEPDKYTVVIDLKPNLDEKTLDNRVLSDFEKHINKNLDNALADLLPSKLIEPFLKMCSLSRFDKPNSLTKQQRRIIVETLKNMKFSVYGFRPVKEAIITSGGVSVKDINSSTMESKKIKGLYFAGEVLDVDAYTGGFNLQIAFSMGALAGVCCAKEKSEDKDV